VAGRRRRPLIIGLAVVLVVLSGYCIVRLIDVWGSLAYEQAVKAVFQEVLGRIGKVRGLSPPANVELRIVTVDWVIENWGRRPAEEALEEIKVQEEIYRALFLIPENVSLLDVRTQQAGYIVAAALNNQIYVVKEYFDPYNQVEARKILAHELTHILQGTYFQSPRLGSHDSRQAWSALVEGDAEFTADMYVGGGLFSVSARLCGTAAQLLLIYPSEIPEPLMEIWLFPYRYGEEFVKTLYEAGGWRRVNQAYESPPETTEQILHPQRYLEGEGFLRLGAVGVNLTGWTCLKRERFGEHFIFVVLKAHLPGEEALRAADGWNGDAFAYYRRGADYLLIWRIAWDAAEDALEFQEAFSNLMEGLRAEELVRNLWRIRGEYVTLRVENLTTLIVGSSTPNVNGLLSLLEAS